MFLLVSARLLAGAGLRFASISRVPRAWSKREIMLKYISRSRTLYTDWESVLSNCTEASSYVMNYFDATRAFRMGMASFVDVQR